MKVTYTYEQAIETLTNLIKYKMGTENVFVDLIPITDWASRIRDNLQQAGCLNVLNEVLPNMKIQAIKSMRQFTSDNQEETGFYTLELSDSKYAIEHLYEFLKFVKKNNRLPASGFCNTGMK